MRCFILFLFLSNSIQAQITVASGVNFVINTPITVKDMDVTTFSNNISGTSKIILIGSSNSNINTNGSDLSISIEINKTANASVSLLSDIKTTANLILTSGNLKLNSYNLTLDSNVDIIGYSATSFIDAGGVGELKKNISGSFVNYIMPVGENLNYTPVVLNSNSGIGTVGVNVKNTVSTNKPSRSTDYINRNWNIDNTGISNLTATSFYINTDIVGSENYLYGFYFDAINNQWNIGNSYNVSQHSITANIPIGNGSIFGMNSFVYVSPKVFLQGCYNSTTGLMTDGLRSIGVIPINDPYRSSPYNNYFSHNVRNLPAEIVSPTVFTNQSNTNDNIVDWVFLELRDNQSPSTVLFTRSALLKRSGDIVELDGSDNKIYFKDILPGNYTLSVRHRNHLGISSNITIPTPLNEKISNIIDFRTSSNIYGNSYAVSSHPTLGAINLLWAGNTTGKDVDGTFKVRNTSLPSDVNAISSGVASFHSNITGSPNYNGYTNVYSILDVNMDGKIFNTAIPSDANKISSNVASYPVNTTGSPNFINFKQILP